MDVALREPGDRVRLEELIRLERHAVQRDRLRAALLASGRPGGGGGRGHAGRSRRFVQAWAYKYRDGGVDALNPGRSTGSADQSRSGGAGLLALLP